MHTPMSQLSEILWNHIAKQCIVNCTVNSNCIGITTYWTLLVNQ